MSWTEAQCLTTRMSTIRAVQRLMMIENFESKRQGQGGSPRMGKAFGR